VPGSHNPSEESTYASNSRENRKRQIRAGFIQLDRLGLAELPTGRRKGAPRFNTVHLNEQGGPTAAGAKRYIQPRSTARVVAIPPEFFLNGWVHALSKSEIAMWLMLRDLSQRSDATSPSDKLHIRGRDRLLQYDLSRAVWDTHARLEEFGLIVVHKIQTVGPTEPPSTVNARSHTTLSCAMRAYARKGSARCWPAWLTYRLASRCDGGPGYSRREISASNV
jgi:hypothetical protein